MIVDKDYYAVLGVLPSVDAPVLQVVYHALVKKHHPDAGGSTSKFLEIQEAYEALRDPKKRANYDQLWTARQEQAGHYDQASESAPASTTNEDLDDEAWEIVREYEPAVILIEQKLHRLSPDISFLFRVIILTNRDFKNAEKIGGLLEDEFIQRYFGDNKTIQIFARSLLSPATGSARRDAARELNRVIRALRNPSDPKSVIRRICDKFGLYQAGEAPRRNLPNTPQGWKIVIAAAEASGWRYKGIFSPKFVNKATGETIAPRTPQDAWIQMGLVEPHAL
ncbi:DnaJ domain-containing protein [Falsiroseomonas sp. HC035]|uniref:DnaJ domain-containing protein n=1 Tax=Falsiroseomonas sp. HC035 TaxID=3390999 RepID=UPI003D323863